MNKRFVRVINLVLSICFILSVSLNVSAADNNSIDSNKITYITEKNDSTNEISCFKDDKVIKEKINKVNSDSLSEINLDDSKYLWIDLDSIKNYNKLTDYISKIYNNNTKIIFKKKNIKIEEITQILGLEKDYSGIYKEEYLDQNLKVTGFMICKSYIDNGYFPTILRSQDNSDTSVLEQMLYVSNSDSIDRKLQSVNKSISASATSASYWAPIGTKAFNDKWNAATVEGSVQLQKASDNPYSGDYYYLTNDEIRYTLNSGYYYSTLTVDHSFTGNLYSYGPQDQTNTTSYSYTIGYPCPTITYTHVPSSALDIAKVSGGYNTKSLGIRFKSSADTYSTASNHVNITAEFYQNSSIYTVPSLGSTTFKYTLKTYNKVFGIITYYGDAVTSFTVPTMSGS